MKVLQAVSPPHLGLTVWGKAVAVGNTQQMQFV